MVWGGAGTVPRRPSCRVSGHTLLPSLLPDNGNYWRGLSKEIYMFHLCVGKQPCKGEKDSGLEKGALEGRPSGGWRREGTVKSSQHQREAKRERDRAEASGHLAVNEERGHLGSQSLGLLYEMRIR